MKTSLLTTGFIFFSVLSASAHAAIKTQTVEYKQNGTALEGFLAYDASKSGKLPAVLIVHDWMGVGEYVESRAKQLAAMGYVAFAADVYGKGVRPKDNAEAAKVAGQYKGNRLLIRNRLKAALEELQKNPKVNPKRIAVIGYCFGGMAALELARSGAEIAGTVSFHGNLDTPNPADAKNIRGKVLALHGADDPFVKPSQVAAFEDEMRKAKVDWQLIVYGGAVHAFTVPSAGNDPSQGMAYDAEADKRSFAAMKQFFSEILSGMPKQR